MIFLIAGLSCVSLLVLSVCLMKRIHLSGLCVLPGFTASDPFMLLLTIGGYPYSLSFEAMAGRWCLLALYVPRPAHGQADSGAPMAAPASRRATGQRETFCCGGMCLSSRPPLFRTMCCGVWTPAGVWLLIKTRDGRERERAAVRLIRGDEFNDKLA